MHSGGLANIGNTCSINTLIQCLAHCTIFANHIINTSENTISIKESKYILYNEIKSIFVLLIIEKKNIIPRRFIRAFYQSIGDSYIVGEELDFTEMWMLLLDRIVDETRKSISGIFYGTQIQQMKCNNCNEVYRNEEQISLHYIHITDKHCIIDSLREMLSGEIITEWKCDKCSKYSGTKSIHLTTLPQILVIIIQRSNTNQKIREAINIALCLFISPSKSTYNLKSIANHYGTQETGHYTAMCVDNENIWYEYNDLHINKISNIEHILLHNKDAYVLFYEKS